MHHHVRTSLMESKTNKWYTWQGSFYKHECRENLCYVYLKQSDWFFKIFRPISAAIFVYTIGHMCTRLSTLSNITVSQIGKSPLILDPYT